MTFHRACEVYSKEKTVASYLLITRWESETFTGSLFASLNFISVHVCAACDDDLNARE